MRLLVKPVRIALFGGAVVAFNTPGIDAAAQTSNANSSHPVPPRAVTAAVKNGSIIIDGKLDEAAWSATEPATDFRQSDPVDGELARLRTEVRFIYDEDALYIGARMFDSLGTAGVRPQLVRRDQISEESDWIRVFLDTFHDHLVTVEFSVNASGAKQDANNGDTSWDPVWESATSIDRLGWVAEIRVPFSQLRYSRAEVQTWGLQVIRFAARLNERSHYAHWMKNETGGTSRYNHLDGLRVGRSFKRVELLPYVVTRNSHIRPDNPDNPFRRKVEYDYRVGGDVKYLLTPNLTLNATINPDFGQVEADPAVINLSAFETSFPEKRPFFIEGSNYFGFGGFSCYFCSNVSSLSTFYSRRIGRRPQVADAARGAAENRATPGRDTLNSSFLDLSENSTIMGAGKITGRTASGWSIGVLDAVTRREVADAFVTSIAIDTTVTPWDTAATPTLHRSSLVVEPLTNYFVTRVKKDYRGGNLTFGGIATSVVRDMGDSVVAANLPGHSEVLGGDFRMFWNSRRYTINGQYTLASVDADPNAMRPIQRASSRYFQRPDRKKKPNAGNGFFTDAYSDTLSVMRGYGGYTRIAKEGGNFLWEATGNWRSPGYETNDLAFSTRSDYLWNNVNIVYNGTKVTKYYRELWADIGAQRQQNYDGDVTDVQLHAYLQEQLPNYWYVSVGAIHKPRATDDRLLRGGPKVRRASNNSIFANLDTDSRKRIVYGFYPSYGRSEEGFTGYGFPFSIRFKPTSNIAINFNPYYGKSSTANQYVRAFNDPTATLFYGRRYVFASLVQHTVEVGTRVQWTFTPQLSLETVVTPLFGSGNYYDYKQFDRPGGFSRTEFGAGQIDSTRSAATGQIDGYSIDPDGPLSSAASTVTFGNPDFNFRSLIGNALLRWEYRPGSTLFVVWQQSRNDSETRGDFDLSHNYQRLKGKNPDNIFLIKMNYWMNF